MKATATGLCLIALAALLLAFSSSPSWGREKLLSVDKQLNDMVRETYKNGEDVYVKVDKLPPQLSESATVKGIDLLKTPDGGGAGLALVHYQRADSRLQSSYVAFKAFEKKQLFYLKRTMKKGQRIEQEDVQIKEAYIGEKSYLYPQSFSDLNGKVLKKDMAAGLVVTESVLEEPQAVRRGQGVMIVCQNKRLVVQTPGKAAENGKRGDRIRVRGLSSDRDIIGRVIDSNTVAVDF